MATSNRSSSAGKAARPSVRRAHISAPKTWEEKDPAVVPLWVQFALRDAMRLEDTQYELNPNGEKSFGNPVEECQGGIRYVIGRYQSANAAKIFWRQHHWY